MPASLSENGSEALTDVEDSSEPSVSDSPSKIVVSPDEPCSSLSDKGCMTISNASSLLKCLFIFAPSLLTNEMTPQTSCMFIFGCESSQVHKHTNRCFCFVFENSKGMFLLKHLFKDT